MEEVPSAARPESLWTLLLQTHEIFRAPFEFTVFFIKYVQVAIPISINYCSKLFVFVSSTYRLCLVA
jgi:hypothetical protein